MCFRLDMKVKRNISTNQSKGFGFIRFADYDSQLKALSQRHLIDNRWCDIRIPNSKVSDIMNVVMISVCLKQF